MKKILFINTTYKGGGASTVARGLFNYSSSAFSCYFAYGRGKRSSDTKTFKFGNSFETFVHIFFVRIFGIEGFGSYFSTRKLINYIEKEKFDLIHLHNLHGYFLNFFYFIDFLNKSNIQIVWTLHDEWILTWLPAHSMGCTHCITGEGECTNSYSYPKTYNKFFHKFILKKRQVAFESLKNVVIVCPANWLADKVRNSYLKNKDIRFIRNGVNINIFNLNNDKFALRTKYNLPTEKKIVLFSSNNLNDINKGVGYIFEAASNLTDKNYLFLGLGMGKAVERAINVKMFGHVGSQEKMAEILALSDLYCFTSTVETSPLSVLEALSCGLPVVAFDIEALKEIINKNIGALVPFGNSDQLSYTIDLYLNNNIKELNSVSKNAREFIVKNFSEIKSLEDYVNIYKNGSARDF